MSGAGEAVPKQLVAGKYQLTRLLGRGGMGSVWEGVHTSLGTRVAVKFIEAEYADSREARGRFENEARAAAALRSKHVVQVFDHGVAEDGRPYIVMEFLAGEPLDKRLERFGRLAPPDTARIVLQVCRALAKAHEAGIVHRDLKPENVFLVWDEEDGADIVKVVDFGIAKFSNATVGLSSATRTGSVLGTPYYMSPEQARGLRSVDYRADLWSVGVITYRCIVGQLPFDGEAVGDLLVKICTGPLPVPSQMGVPVPPGFDEWFARALQREPAARFGSAMELGDALCRVCGVPMRARLSSATPEGGQLPTGSQTQPLSPTPVGAASGGLQSGTSGIRRGGPNGTTPMPAVGVTAGPVTQTAPTISASKPRAGVLAAVVGVALVLAGGVALALKLSGPAREAEPIPEPSAAAPVAESPQPPSPQLEPVVKPAESAQPATPVASATAAPTPSTQPTPPTPAAQRPAPPRPPPRRQERPERPRQQPAPPTTRPPIDVGY